MPKVLIICGSFPPHSAVGGLRPAMMAKFLPRYGWETHVLTRAYGDDHPLRDEYMHLGSFIPENRVCRVNISAQNEREYLVRRGLHGKIRDIVTLEKAFPPGIFDRMWEAAKCHCLNSGFDLIWATFPDLPQLRIGHELSICLGAPWIADFRDIEEQDEKITKGWRLRLLHLRSNFRRKQLVRNASCLTSVSSFHCRTLKQKTGKPCEVIYNGYDAEMFRPLEPLRSERFKIVYTGRILSKGLRNPELFFEALDALLGEGKIDARHVEILFYATEPDLLKDIAGKYRSWGLCRILDRIRYTEVPSVLGKASILLLLSEYERYGILTTKLFEYLAVERPILCVRTEPDSEIADIVHKANAGYAGDDIEKVMSFILHCYERWRALGYCTAAVKREYIINFSRETQAGRLAGLMNHVIRISGADA